MPFSETEKPVSSCREGQWTHLTTIVGPAQDAIRPRVLVVDHNATHLRLAQEMLRVLGYEVALAMNGREAVEYVESHQPIAILMDLDMPEMDGAEATEHIRSRERQDRDMKRPVKIIATTVTADDHARRRCMEAGMSGLVAKPLLLTSLASTLSNKYAAAY